MDIDDCLRSLARTRPLFHSEADFQHALAWELHTVLPDASIRLEFRADPNAKIYVDLWVNERGERIAIELKYKTRSLTASVGGESFNLLNQSAQDIGRYDFLKDVQRIERLVEAGLASEGYAVFLSNDRGYWRKGRSNTVDAAFRIDEGQSMSGTLAWASQASAGTMDSREEPLELRQSHFLRWEDYSRVSDGISGAFRYLVVHVPESSARRSR